MNFRKAEKKEAKLIKVLYRSVIGDPFCTWDESYPGEEEIRGDLEAGTLYVLEEAGDLIGAVSIVPENEFDELDCWKVKENAREFARVVIRPDLHHQGLSRYLVDGVLKELKSQHVAAVHIAVARDNIPARKLYQKAGFSFCGEADMFGHHFILCEKML